MTDERTEKAASLDMYDQIAEWCAVLEACAEDTKHPYRQQKLAEVAEHLRGLRAPEGLEGLEGCDNLWKVQDRLLRGLGLMERNPNLSDGHRKVARLALAYVAMSLDPNGPLRAVRADTEGADG